MPPTHSSPIPPPTTTQPYLHDEEDGDADAGAEAADGGDDDGDGLAVQLDRNLRQLLGLLQGGGGIESGFKKKEKTLVGFAPIGYMLWGAVRGWRKERGPRLSLSVGV